MPPNEVELQSMGRSAGVMEVRSDEGQFAWEVMGLTLRPFSRSKLEVVV